MSVTGVTMGLAEWINMIICSNVQMETITVHVWI